MSIKSEIEELKRKQAEKKLEEEIARKNLIKHYCDLFAPKAKQLLAPYVSATRSSNIIPMIGQLIEELQLSADYSGRKRVVPTIKVEFTAKSQWEYRGQRGWSEVTHRSGVDYFNFSGLDLNE
ncbi:MAG: hypothetical protein MN733_38105, partial [Nitrososphaera sp.]|nr:hypothetical protein [Nitrososphaera sp.]